jgi:CRP-like cAMP-binding protein
LPKKGDIIFRQGDISDYIYYISSGQYSVYHNDTVVGVMTPADIFMGEMSFLLNNHRSATVIAETDGKIIKISRKSFVQSIRSYPQYGLFLSKLLATESHPGQPDQFSQKREKLTKRETSAPACKPLPSNKTGGIHHS